MGSLTSNFCGIDARTEEYMERIEATIKLTGRNNGESDLLENHRDRLMHMINAARPGTETLGNYQAEIILVPPTHPLPEQPSSSVEQQVKLVLKKEVEGSERSFSTQEGRRQGYIILPEACYHGWILNDQAHGQGTVYCPGYQITGEWQHDAFRSGRITKLVPQLNVSAPTIARINCCKLQLLNGQREAIVITEDFEYRGSVVLRRATSVNEMMTGSGSIIYRNGDIYKGELVKGLFQTSKGIESIFTCREEDKSFTFRGFYKNGLRDGPGMLEIETDGKRFSVFVSFEKGVAVKTGLVTSSDNDAFPLEVTADGLLVRLPFSPLRSQ